MPRLPNTGASGGSRVAAAGCRRWTPDALAKHIGYTAEELAALPGGANIGLVVRQPRRVAALRPGEVLLDLGSGAGFDAFIAAPKVGPTGRVIGVDMTAEMLAKARKNIAAFRERTGLDNVEFRLGEIEHCRWPTRAWM